MFMHSICTVLRSEMPAFIVTACVQKFADVDFPIVIERKLSNFMSRATSTKSVLSKGARRKGGGSLAENVFLYLGLGRQRP